MLLFFSFLVSREEAFSANCLHISRQRERERPGIPKTASLFEREMEGGREREGEEREVM